MRQALFARSAFLSLAAALAFPAAAQTGTPAVADPGHAAEGRAPAGTSAETDSGAAQGQEIIVTGSRIRHNPIDQPSPVTFVDQQDIARTGLSSIADVLQRLPSSAGGLNTKNNSSGNLGNPQDGGGVGAGTSEINLRYLGSKRTLVLVDSLRFVNASSASGVPGSVDLNSIPQAAIERVEVLQDGASAIYGSDAIAGVVNIITKTKQDGLLVSVQRGLFAEGDGQTTNADVSYGFGSNKTGTQVVVGASYVQQDPVFAGDRAFSRFPSPHATTCTANCSGTTPLGRFRLTQIDPATGQATDITLNQAVSGRPPFDPLNPTGPGSAYHSFTDADRYNFQPTNYLLTPYKRYSAFANVEQPLGGDIKLSGKFFFNRRESANQAAPLPLVIGPDAGNGNLLDTISIDASNPYNPFGELAPGTYNTVQRRLVEGGSRHYSQRVDSYYGTATLSGKFKFLNHDWFWDLNGVYGDTRANQSFTGNVNAANVATALGPVANCTGACVPLDVFGGAGTITPAMYNYIAFTEHDRSAQRIWDGSANLSGALFDLPAGPVGVAIGYEHRDLKGSFTPDALIQAGLGADIPAQATAGRYNADEIYGELSVPILKDKPFFQSLNGSFAVRHSNFSLSGSKTTFKGGGDWKPFNDLLVRGSYAQGFRAPSIGELFGSLSRFDDPLTDPCNNINGASAGVRSNCIANGVPANGSYSQTGQQLPVLTGGNTSLRPETSHSWVGGAVYDASWARPFARTLSLEASYFNIRVNDAIGAIDAATLLDRCAETGDALSCASIHRSASGEVTQIVGTLQNISSLKTDGLDLNFNYRSPRTAYGSFGLYWANTLTFHYTEIVPATEGVTRIERKGTESGSQAFPKLRSLATLEWSLGQFTASVTGRYTSAVTESTGDYAGHQLGRRLYGDLQLIWDTRVAHRDFSFTVGVNNIAGTAPPACYSCQISNYDPSVYDLPGQFFYVRAGVKI